MSDCYEFIDGLKYDYPTVKMCEWLEVSTSGFYEWRSRPTSATAQRRAELKVRITEIFDDSDGTYGYRRVHAALARQGVPCGPELVRDLMCQLELVACQPRPWRPTTTLPGVHETVPDLVQRDFTADAPGEKLVGDITYIRTWQGWSYLATVIDCYHKAVVGWALAEHMRTDLVTDALAMAARNHDLARDAVFHSDRGSQYLSGEFAEQLGRLGMRQSVGRTGVCFDNALAESFNATLKIERVNRTQYPTRRHAETDVARYIELRYNRKRLHSGLGYQTPQEVYNEYINRPQAA